VAGVRALGLFDKMVTVPLWKVIERKDHVRCMTARYEQMLAKFVRWSKDATNVLKGKECVFDDVEVSKDWVYDSLVKECELDELTNEVLGLLFAGFVKKTRMLVPDQLEEGVNADMEADRVKETQNVPTNNVSVERDFGMLDNLMRARPSAYTCAIEGAVMYKCNRTSAWLSDMSEERVHDIMEVARMSVVQQKDDYMRRKEVNAAKHKEYMEKNKNLKECKEMKEKTRVEEISVQIGMYGGLWVSKRDIVKRLKGISGMENRRNAIECQLKFRKFVLKEKNVDGCLNVTSGGERIAYEKMVENLKCVVCGVKEQLQDESDNENERSDMHGASEEALNEVKVKYMQVNESAMGHERKRKCRNACDKRPNVISMNDYVGKRIKYLGEKGIWVRGTVVGVRMIINCGKQKWLYDVRFDGCDEIVEMDWTNEIRNGAVKVIRLCIEDLVGREIEHLCKDERTGIESWWKACVIDCVNKRSMNPKFILRYECSVNGHLNDSDMDECFSFCLFEDYVNGDLKLL